MKRVSSRLTVLRQDLGLQLYRSVTAVNIFPPGLACDGAILNLAIFDRSSFAMKEKIIVIKIIDLQLPT